MVKKKRTRRRGRKPSPRLAPSATQADADWAQPHDALVKRLLGPPSEAAAYLASTLPAGVAQRVDWSTLALCNGSFVDADFRRTSTDLLYEARIDGKQGYLYFLLEHQSTVDPLMPLRVLVYLGRIWDQWIRAQEERPTRLPAILPLVLYHGTDRWTAPTELHELVDASPELLDALRPHLPNLKLLIDDLSTQDDDQLRARALSAVPLLLLLCLKHMRTVDDLGALAHGLTDLVVEVLDSPRGLDAMTAVLRYAALVRRGAARDVFAAVFPATLVDELPEDLVNFSEQIIREGLQQVLHKGHRDGLAEGRKEGLKNTLLKQLRLKFRELPQAVIDRVEAAELAELDRWAEHILTAATPEEVLDG